MNEDEITVKLTKIDQLMNQLIFAFMQTGMSYRQAEEELFRRLKRKKFIEETTEERLNQTPSQGQVNDHRRRDERLPNGRNRILLKAGAQVAAVSVKQKARCKQPSLLQPRWDNTTGNYKMAESGK